MLKGSNSYLRIISLNESPTGIYTMHHNLSCKIHYENCFDYISMERFCQGTYISALKFKAANHNITTITQTITEKNAHDKTILISR